MIKGLQNCRPFSFLCPRKLADYDAHGKAKSEPSKQAA
jgi:hypothetical protein